MGPSDGVEHDAWVLFIDIDGFSARVARATDRTRLFEAYREVVKCLNDDGLRRAIFGAVPPLLDSSLGVLQDAVRAVDGEESPVLREAAAVISQSAREQARRFADERSRTVWRDRVRIISDTIIIIFDGDPNPHTGEPHSPSTIEVVASSVSASLWKAGLPHRGAITQGKCLLDYDNAIILGAPIVEGYQWQVEQDWLGISYAPSAATRATTAMTFNDKLAAMASVPTKHQGEVLTRAVSPISDLSFARGMVGTSFFRAHRDKLSTQHELMPDLLRMMEVVASVSVLPTPDEIVDGFRLARDEARATGAPERAVARYERTESLWRRFGLFEKADLLAKMKLWTG